MRRSGPKQRDMYGIEPTPGGFEVSLMRQGVRYHAHFAVSRWGSEAEALREAQAWRDSIVRSVPPVERRARAVKLRSSNQTGIAGVSMVLGRDGNALGWKAHTYIAPGRRLQTYFSIKRYGELARDLAISARHAQLELMEGFAKLHPAEEQIRSSATGRLPRLHERAIAARRNPSGPPGVQFKPGRRDHPGYWVADTHISGLGRMRKSFSIKTHGFETAKALALEERARQVAQKKASAT